MIGINFGFLYKSLFFFLCYLFLFFAFQMPLLSFSYGCSSSSVSSLFLFLSFGFCMSALLAAFLMMLRVKVPMLFMTRLKFRKGCC